MSRKQEIERALPTNTEAEQAVLGAVILNSSLYEESLLSRDHFFDHRHQLVWDAFDKILKRGSVIDLVTLTDALARNSEIVDAGGVAYISSLIDGRGKIKNVEQHARLVRESAAQRRAIHLAEAIKERAFNCLNVDEMIEEAARNFVDLSATSSAGIEWTTEFAASIEALEQLENDKGPRIYTGIQAIDEETGGFIAGELIEVVSGTGVGKTLFSRQVQQHSCGQGWHGLYASGEMFGWHLATRRIFSDAGVPTHKYRHPERITDSDRAKLVDVAAHACKQCAILDGDLSLSRIRAAARKLSRKTKLGLVVIDYDSLVSAPGKDQNERQVALMRGAKAIGMENHCAVINISQLRKSPAATKKGQDAPTLDDIYGSKTTSAHPSWVFYIEREYMKTYAPGTEAKARIVIMKARDGRVGETTSDIMFDIDRLRFRDVRSA